MDPGSEQNGAPDSWEQNDAGGVGDAASVESVSKPLSALSLNVNACEFVPGRNINATAFVPSFLKQPDQAPEPTPAAESTDTHMENDTEPAAAAAEEEVPPDDWADKEDEEEKENGEEEEEDEEEQMETETEQIQAKPPPPKPTEAPVVTRKGHVNVVFIGHVDAGKSTIGGHIMYLTGQVDKRTLEKYEKEAKEKNRETWYLSWALDTNQEERDKGKTVEVGRAKFETEDKHFTILDAPGHRSFVPNMIGGASQADVAVLVISARKGEFETGFERGGQTREHAMLAKTAGVKQLIVLVNKMDDPTVEWNKDRYEEILTKLTPYLKKCGFNPKTDITFMPASGLSGAFLRDPAPESVCPWYRGPCFLEYLNSLPSFNRLDKDPLRIPIVDKYKDMGIIVLGKVEAGTIEKGLTYTLMPNRVVVEISQIWSDEDDTDSAYPGENVKAKLRGIEEEDVSSGFVLCSSNSLCNTGKIFDAQIVILEHKSIICAGYSAVLHLHTVAEEVTIKVLLSIIDKKTGEKTKKPRFVKQDQIAEARFVVNGGLICMETFKDFPQMGRFTLRDEGRTIGIGKVLKIRE